MRLIDAEALKKAYFNAINETSIGEVSIIALIDNAPTVEPAFNPIAEVKFDKEQLQEIVDKAKAEVLASVERPQGEWIERTERITLDTYYECSNCKEPWTTIEGTPWQNMMNFCPNCGAKMNCGADMRPKSNHLRDCENCVHHSENGCEVWECEFKRRSS